MRVLGKEEFAAALREQTEQFLSAASREPKATRQTEETPTDQPLVPSHQEIFSFRWVSELRIQMTDPWNKAKTVTAKYSGEILDGKPHGLGRFIVEGEGHGFGNFKDGQLHGQGCFENAIG